MDAHLGRVTTIENGTRGENLSLAAAAVSRVEARDTVVADALAPRSLATVHGDLHWANVLCPTLGLLDWELWGRGPVGLDPATLWVFSLCVPEVAQRVWDTFGDVLDSPDGRAALVTVASRILYRASDYPDLVPLVTVWIRHWLERVAAS